MKSMHKSLSLRAVDSSASIHTRQFLRLSEFSVSEKLLRRSSSCAVMMSSRIADRFGFLNSENSSKDSNLRVNLSAQSAVIFIFGRKEDTSLQNSSRCPGVTTKTEFSMVDLLIFISPLARMSQQALDSLMFVGLCTIGQHVSTARYIPLLSATKNGARRSSWKDRFGSKADMRNQNIWSVSGRPIPAPPPQTPDNPQTGCTAVPARYGSRRVRASRR